MSLLCVILVLAAGITPCWGEDLVAEGNRALDAGRPRDAIALLQRAAASSSGSHFPIHISLASAYFAAGEYRSAEDVLKHIEKPPSGSAAHAQLLNALGGLHLVQLRLDEADRELSEALKILRHHPEGNEILPAVLNNLCGVETRLGRVDEGLKHGLEAMRIWQENLSEHHPDLIRIRGSLSAIQYLKGNFREAHSLLEQAIAPAEITYGATDQTVAALLASDALVLEKLKRSKEAKVARQRAQQIRPVGDSAVPNSTTRNAKEALLPDSRIAIRTQ